MTGNVTFGPAGPPQFTAEVGGSYTSGTISTLFGSAGGTVSFELRVVETNPPPVQVTEVPITITAHGFVQVTGSPQIYPYAVANLTVNYDGGQFVDKAIAATIIPTPVGSFDVTQTQSFAPGQILTGTMGAVASVVIRSLDEETEYVIPASEVAKIDLPAGGGRKIHG